MGMKIMRKGDDILCRIFYLDRMFEKYTYSGESNPENMTEEFNKIKKQSEQLSMEEIEEEVLKLNPRNRGWFDRFKNKTYVEKEVKINALFIEPEHDALDGIPHSAGKRLVDFLEKNKNNQEVSGRLNFVLEHFDLLKEVPIIVKERDKEYFEIMSGYHKAMAHIMKGFDTIDVLVIS